MSKKYCFRSLSLIVLFRFFSCLVFREFVSRLQKANKTVYLITGGFDCLIEPIAEELNIPLDHMFANKLFFQFNGKPLKWVVGNESDSTWCSWSETWAVNSRGCNMDLASVSLLRRMKEPISMLRSCLSNNSCCVYSKIKEITIHFRRSNTVLYGRFYSQPLKYSFKIWKSIYWPEHLISMCVIQIIFLLQSPGKYAGFDTNQPTSRTGGKGEAINTIRRTHGQNTVVTMIGDGATDLEASPPADSFVGYGGNVVRDEVRNRAQYYVIDFQQLYKDLWRCLYLTIKIHCII